MKLYTPETQIVANSRQIWQDALVEIGERDENVIALTADLGRSICTDRFRDTFPARFFNVGIAEQDMIGISAGLALKGKLPYAVSYATFVSMRACEQFRTDCCYQNLNVRVLGCAGGLTGGGPTHSGMEDAGIIRCMPNATVVCASDPYMFPKILNASLTHQGPMYIRMTGGRGDEQVYAEDYEFQLGKAIVAREGRDATVISFGAMLAYANKAASQLAGEGIDVGIVDMHTLKPLDRNAILAAAKATGRIVTIEDHTIYNGLGSAVAEVIAEAGVPCKFRRLGVPDIFATFGPPKQLHKKYGYDADALAAAIKGLA